MRSAQTIKTNIHSAVTDVALRRHPSRIYCNQMLPDKEVNTVLNRIPVGREDDPNLEIVRRILASSKDYFFTAYYDDDESALEINAYTEKGVAPALTLLGVDAMCYDLTSRRVSKIRDLSIAIGKNGDYAVWSDEENAWTFYTNDMAVSGDKAVDALEAFWAECVTNTLLKTRKENLHDIERFT